MMKNLFDTEETEAVYQAILDYWAENALPPSLDDLATRLGKSKTATKWHVLKLKKMGKITTKPNVRRSILPVGMTITLPA